MGNGVKIEFTQEVFPPPRDSEFTPLFVDHAMEVRGRTFHLDYKRLEELERKDRLVWIVARHTAGPIGYALGWWYRDMHFNEIVGADDLWWVAPGFRMEGIGRTLKLNLHSILKAKGAVRMYETVRNEYNHPKLMADLEYEPWGVRWSRKL